ncbi:hypothetical protein NM208_g9609 [Fusarium decemcellulare]|uniref:Uncharacterized protein n=1 Tax=Fusarium decemcellulare TaxID=57161 RepID=A0ACC1S0Y9_9HYPO|nr:hypothetical protein NM208_g9609 [Fusarium decemcellulare]
MASKQLRIGVFIPSGAQFLDVATVDVLASMSKEYLGHLPMLPAHIGDMAPSTKITYITSPTLFPDVPLTADLSIRATHTFEDQDVAPGQLDIVVVPGPHRRPNVLSVCTGILLCGAAGILKGKTASGPRGLQDVVLKRHPEVKLVGEKYRWVQDGNLWSNLGGVTNGNDLMAAYARASPKHWPGPVAEMGAMLTDVGDRSQIYREGKSRFVLGVAWQIIKAWFLSLGSSSETKSKAN